MDTINNINKAVEEIYLEQGLQQINIANIAKKASIAKKTIYKLFSNKQEILENITRSIVEKHKSENQLIISGTASIDERLNRLIASDLALILTIDSKELSEMRKCFESSWEILVSYLSEGLSANYVVLFEQRVLPQNTKSISSDELADLTIRQLLSTAGINKRKQQPEDQTRLKQITTEFILNAVQ